MPGQKRCVLLTPLFLISLLLASFPALAQRTGNPLLPNVNLGLPKLGVGASVTVPPITVPRNLSAIPQIGVPRVELIVAPPVASAPNLSVSVGGEVGKLNASTSLNLPAVGGLTPPISAKVNVNTGSPGPLLEVGANVVGPAPGSPPVPETYAPAAAQQGQQMAERRLDLVPTCR